MLGLCPLREWQVEKSSSVLDIVDGSERLPQLALAGYLM